MLILSYNPRNDEFFIGLSEEEFEQVAGKYAVDFGYNMDYEMTKEHALRKMADSYHVEMIKQFYQIDEVPFICIVTNRDCSEIGIRPKHFPFANHWNGYSPWIKIEVQEIENLEAELLPK